MLNRCYDWTVEFFASLGMVQLSLECAGHQQHLAPSLVLYIAWFFRAFLPDFFYIQVLWLRVIRRMRLYITLQ